MLLGSWQIWFQWFENICIWMKRYNKIFREIFWWLLINFVLIVRGSASSKVKFFLENLYVSRKLKTESFTCWRRIHFCGRNIQCMASFYAQLLQLSVIQLRWVCFFRVKLVNAHKKTANAAEIIKNKHGILVLVTVAFSHGKNFDQGRCWSHAR